MEQRVPEQITRAAAFGEARIARFGAALTKRVIQVHAVDAAGAVVCRHALRRDASWTGVRGGPRERGGHGDQVPQGGGSRLPASAMRAAAGSLIRVGSHLLPGHPPNAPAPCLNIATTLQSTSESPDALLVDARAFNATCGLNNPSRDHQFVDWTMGFAEPVCSDLQRISQAS